MTIAATLARRKRAYLSTNPIGDALVASHGTPRSKPPTYYALNAEGLDTHLVAPSIGVSRVDYDFDDFGPYRLIFNADYVGDVVQQGRAKAFHHDAWTPRYYDIYRALTEDPTSPLHTSINPLPVRQVDELIHNAFTQANKHNQVLPVRIGEEVNIADGIYTPNFMSDSNPHMRALLSPEAEANDIARLRPHMLSKDEAKGTKEPFAGLDLYTIPDPVRLNNKINDLLTKPNTTVEDFYTAIADHIRLYANENSAQRFVDMLRKEASKPSTYAEIKFMGLVPLNKVEAIVMSNVDAEAAKQFIDRIGRGVPIVSELSRLPKSTLRKVLFSSATALLALGITEEELAALQQIADGDRR